MKRYVFFYMSYDVSRTLVEAASIEEAYRKDNNGEGVGIGNAYGEDVVVYLGVEVPDGADPLDVRPPDIELIEGMR